nr:unnamed protein product [Callosobruchus analis]
MVLCCKDEEVVETTLKLDVEVEEESELSFCSVKEILNDASKSDISILTELIKHKNHIIKSQQLTIKTIMQQIKIMNEQFNTTPPSVNREIVQPIKNVEISQTQLNSKWNRVPKVTERSTNTIKNHPKGEESANTFSSSNRITGQQVALAVEQARKSAAASPVPSPPSADQSVVQTDDGDDAGGTWQHVNRKRSKPRRSLVVGGDSDTSVIKGVEKKVVLHVSRVDPKADVRGMESFLKTNFREVIVEKISSKFPEVYSSFKVTIPESDFPLAMDASKWPKNSSVNRFFNRRKNVTHPS